MLIFCYNLVIIITPLVTSSEYLHQTLYYTIYCMNIDDTEREKKIIQRMIRPYIFFIRSSSSWAFHTFVKDFVSIIDNVLSDRLTLFLIVRTVLFNHVLRLKFITINEQWKISYIICLLSLLIASSLLSLKSRFVNFLSYTWY